jgi:hypothetical protein
MALGLGIRQLDVAHQVSQVAAIDFDANGTEPGQRRRVPYECHAIQSRPTVALPLIDRTDRTGGQIAFRFRAAGSQWTSGKKATEDLGQS